MPPCSHVPCVSRPTALSPPSLSTPSAHDHTQIKCHGISYESSTYEDFMDLSLEITRAPSVLRALQHFCSKEVLDGDNKYR